MQKNHLRRHQPAGMPPSPRLLRSRSGNPATSLPEVHANTSSSSAMLAQRRSKSTTKSRTNKGEENLNMTSPRIPKKPQGSRDHSNFLKLLQRSQRTNTYDQGVKRPMRISTPSSPSAWALSPGRALPSSPVPPKSSSSGKLKMELGSGGGVSGVLKYFRQKKVSLVQEEQFHQFRTSQNRLLQWRFVNARAEASRNAVKVLAERKLFGVWLRISTLRNAIIEKGKQMQKLKHEIKVYQITSPQICLLKEWERLERKNSEAVGRMTRKLSAISIRLPLERGAEAEVLSVTDAMNAAMGTMDSIEAVVTKFLPQVEKVCFLITELIITEKQQKEYTEELKHWISTIASLEAKERTLRAHLLQAAKESEESQLAPDDGFGRNKSD